jgi:hypothetical protein
MPTYADTTLYWNNAITFYPLTQVPFRHDFSTLYGTNPGGPGFIGGLVSQGSNKTGSIGDPVPGLRLFLQNRTTGEILGYRTTDVNGYFSFAGIPLADYEIVPDRPNVSTTNVPLLTLTAQTPVMDSLDLQLHRYWLELVPPATGFSANGAFEFNAMPNPFGGNTRIVLNLSADAQVEMEVYDVTGKQMEPVFAGHVKKGSHHFGMGDDLKAGIYFVRLRLNDEEKVLKVLKVE